MNIFVNSNINNNRGNHSHKSLRVFHFVEKYYIHYSLVAMLIGLKWSSCYHRATTNHLWVEQTKPEVSFKSTLNWVRDCWMKCTCTCIHVNSLPNYTHHKSLSTFMPPSSRYENLQIYKVKMKLLYFPNSINLFLVFISLYIHFFLILKEISMISLT